MITFDDITTFTSSTNLQRRREFISKNVHKVSVDAFSIEKLQARIPAKESPFPRHAPQEWPFSPSFSLNNEEPLGS
jgi:hypothetical protein